jgi:hypothetical protein
MSGEFSYLVVAPDVACGFALPSPAVLKAKRQECKLAHEASFTKQLLVNIDRVIERYAKCLSVVDESNVRKRQRNHDHPHLRVHLYSNDPLSLVDRLLESIRTKSQGWVIKREGHCIHLSVVGAPNAGTTSGSEDEDEEDEDELYVAPHSESEPPSSSDSDSEDSGEPARKKTKVETE